MCAEFVGPATTKKKWVFELVFEWRDMWVGIFPSKKGWIYFMCFMLGFRVKREKAE